MEQEGFYLGTAFELAKEDKYINFTLVGGRGKIEDQKNKNEKFDIYSFSTALKLGVEYKISKNLSIDPSLILGYHNIISDGYTNKNDVNISSETTNIFNISPKIKTFGNIKEFKPYVSLAYNYNSYSGGDIKGDNGSIEAILPRVEINSYSEMRIGISKAFINNSLKTYGEVIAREGDKDSFGGQIGMEYKL